MRTRIKQRMLRRIALAFAVAAVAAPTAQAGPLEPGATGASVEGAAGECDSFVCRQRPALLVGVGERRLVELCTNQN